MNSSITTMDNVLGNVNGLRSLKDLWGSLRSAVTKTERRSFQLGEELRIEMQFEEREPEWLVPCLERISRVLSLPENWDTYGGRRVKPLSAIGAFSFLLGVMQDGTPLPDVSPHRNGTLRLEWHTTKGDLEVEILAPRQYRISYANARGEIEVEDLLTRDSSLAIEPLMEIAG